MQAARGDLARPQETGGVKGRSMQDIKPRMVAGDEDEAALYFAFKWTKEFSN